MCEMHTDDGMAARRASINQAASATSSSGDQQLSHSETALTDERFSHPPPPSHQPPTPLQPNTSRLTPSTRHAQAGRRDTMAALGRPHIVKLLQASSLGLVLVLQSAHGFLVVVPSSPSTTSTTSTKSGSSRLASSRSPSSAPSFLRSPVSPALTSRRLARDGDEASDSEGEPRRRRPVPPSSPSQRGRSQRPGQDDDEEEGASSIYSVRGGAGGGSGRRGGGGGGRTGFDEDEEDDEYRSMRPAALDRPRPLPIRRPGTLMDLAR